MKKSDILKTLESNKKLLMTYGTTLVGKEDENMVILGRTDKIKQKIAPLFPYYLVSQSYQYFCPFRG